MHNIKFFATCTPKAMSIVYRYNIEGDLDSVIKPSTLNNVKQEGKQLSQYR